MRDYRDNTGEEALWSENMFSGMPGYLINVQWGNVTIGYVKKILSFNLPHPICNIYLALLSYYILLLAFGVRPYLAVAGAIAFGLSSPTRSGPEFYRTMASLIFPYLLDS